MPLASIAAGPYLEVASFLGPLDLCRTDAACHLLLTLNALPAGPWYVIGDRAFYGMELDVGGGFLPFDQDASTHSQAQTQSQPSTSATSWKARCELFRRHAPTFSPPFSGTEIMSVEHPDEVAYCRCRLRTDLLSGRSARGVYVEVEVLANADNLSLAVVDFEGGGRSSVTFSPETGAVLRERKVRESPRAIEGTYIHLLPAAPPGRRFEGAVGLYLYRGHLAFFRRWSSAGLGLEERERDRERETERAGPGPGLGLEDPEMEDRANRAEAEAEAGAAAGADAGVPAAAGTDADAAAGTEADAAADADDDLGLGATAPTSGRAQRQGPEQTPWETTGFCTDLRWAQGARLSMCLAFRDDGAYHVRVARVGRSPPAVPSHSRDAYQENKWSLLYGDDDHPLAI